MKNIIYVSDNIGYFMHIIMKIKLLWAKNLKIPLDLIKNYNNKL